MNVTVSDISETRKDIVVSVSGDEISEEESRILNEFKKQAKIPGFRPGKAPEHIIKSRYKKELQEQLNRTLIQKAYEEASNNSEVNIYSVVDFPEPGDFVAGQEMTLDMTVDVTPEFEVPEYKGLEAEVPPTEVSDEDVDQTIDRIRRQRADFEVVEREAQVSDYVKVSYEGTLDGEKLADKLGDEPRLKAWGSVSEGWEEAGTDEAKEFGVPPIIDKLVGMKAEDTAEVEYTFPEDFSVEELRGKTAKYSIEVHEVRERKLPEIDEEFLKSVRAETLEDFKSQILDELENQKKRETEDQKRQQIMDKLSMAVDFPLPESGVEGETQNTLQRLMSQNLQQGVSQEELEKHREQLFETSQQMAKRDVKLQLIIAKIAEKEGIKVEDEDLSRAIYSIAMQTRQQPEEVVKELRKDRGRLMEIQRQLLFSKTLDFLIEQAKVTEQSKDSSENSES